jgi:hypothetical protein
MLAPLDQMKFMREVMEMYTEDSTRPHPVAELLEAFRRAGPTKH